MSILICYDGSPRALEVAAHTLGGTPAVLLSRLESPAVEPDLLGSVSNALVHHATCPVLVVPSPPSRSS